MKAILFMISKGPGGEIQDNNDNSLTYDYDDPNLVFPIPQRELDANPELVQNPGYGE